MDVKRQQGGADQGDLFDEALKAALRHGVNGEGGTGPETRAAEGTGSAAMPMTATSTCGRRRRGERVMASVTAFLEGKLRLKVNQRKSAAAPVGERQFLGHRLGKRGLLGIGRKSLERAKDRLREATRRNRGIALDRMVAEANRFIVGWVTYYRDARCRGMLLDLDGWLRRKVRCARLKQCKNPATIADFLRENGVRDRPARQLASSGKGWWRLSNTEQAKTAMPNDWFDSVGLVRMADHHAALNRVGNRRGT